MYSPVVYQHRSYNVHRNAFRDSQGDTIWNDYRDSHIGIFLQGYRVLQNHWLLPMAVASEVRLIGDFQCAFPERILTQESDGTVIHADIHFSSLVCRQVSLVFQKVQAVVISHKASGGNVDAAAACGPYQGGIGIELAFHGQASPGGDGHIAKEGQAYPLLHQHRLIDDNGAVYKRKAVTQVLPASHNHFPGIALQRSAESGRCVFGFNVDGHGFAIKYFGGGGGGVGNGEFIHTSDDEQHTNGYGGGSQNPRRTNQKIP